MMAGIWGLLAALPEMIKLGAELFKWIKGIVGDNPKKFIKDMGAAIEDLNKAKSAEDRMASAVAISQLIKRM